MLGRPASDDQCRSSGEDQCEAGEEAGEDERARARTDHFLALLLLVVAEAPGATPSSASGSLGSLAEACCAALTTSSRLDRLMIEPSRTSKNANARPVSPMRMRCALLPA